MNGFSWVLSSLMVKNPMVSHGLPSHLKVRTIWFLIVYLLTERSKLYGFSWVLSSLMVKNHMVSHGLPSHLKVRTIWFLTVCFLF